MSKKMIAIKRLYLNSTRDKVVEAGDKNAAFLYASPGTVIPASAVEQFKLEKKTDWVADADAPAGSGEKAETETETEDKSTKKTEGKSAKKTEDKSAKKTEDKSGASNK